MYVFAYGSLLQPESLRRTLPEIDIRACIPAVIQGYVRGFDVAFPNDGSQADKAYFDADNRRPPVVLLCNLLPRDNAATNGICVPVGDEELEALRGRELRYDLHTVTEQVSSYAGWPALSSQVYAFVGKSAFTAPSESSRGILPQDYLSTIASGGEYWDRQVPGFAQQLAETTELPPASRIQPLTRVDGRSPA